MDVVSIYLRFVHTFELEILKIFFGIQPDEKISLAGIEHYNEEEEEVSSLID